MTCKCDVLEKRITTLEGQVQTLLGVKRFADIDGVLRDISEKIKNSFDKALEQN